jgi:hypothetical protein
MPWAKDKVEELIFREQWKDRAEKKYIWRGIIGSNFH